MLLNPFAIFAGLFVDLVLSVLFTALALAIYASMTGNTQPDQAWLQQLMASPGDYPSLAAMLLVAGALADGIAGNVTGRLAKRLELWHALVLFLLLVTLHYAVRQGLGEVSGLELLSLLVGAAAMMKGAALARQRRSRGERL